MRHGTFLAAASPRGGAAAAVGAAERLQAWLADSFVPGDCHDQMPPELVEALLTAADFSPVRAATVLSPPSPRRRRYRRHRRCSRTERGGRPTLV